MTDSTLNSRSKKPTHVIRPPRCSRGSIVKNCKNGRNSASQPDWQDDIWERKATALYSLEYREDEHILQISILSILLQEKKKKQWRHLGADQTPCQSSATRRGPLKVPYYSHFPLFILHSSLKRIGAASRDQLSKKYLDLWETVYLANCLQPPAKKKIIRSCWCFVRPLQHVCEGTTTSGRNKHLNWGASTNLEEVLAPPALYDTIKGWLFFPPSHFLTRTDFRDTCYC